MDWVTKLAKLTPNWFRQRHEIELLRQENTALVVHNRQLLAEVERLQREVDARQAAERRAAERLAPEQESILLVLWDEQWVWEERPLELSGLDAETFKFHFGELLLSRFVAQDSRDLGSVAWKLGHEGRRYVLKKGLR